MHQKNISIRLCGDFVLVLLEAIELQTLEVIFTKKVKDFVLFSLFKGDNNFDLNLNMNAQVLRFLAQTLFEL